jgi:molybdopterin molybdotransferase
MALLALDEARARVLAGCLPLHPRAVPIDEALGCVTSVPLSADEPVPPFANTAMDGFAVRAADTAAVPARLRVTATLAAGADPTGLVVAPGTAVRIMTGAPIPEGADAVVMVEVTSVEGDVVVVQQAAAVGDHVRPAGDDIAAGQEVVAARTVLTAGHLGVLASLGYVKVPVFPRARVGVLSTGDELVDGSAPLRPGQIRDANRHTLVALLSQAGCVPVDLGLVGDDEGLLAAAVEKGLAGCDALVTSGGVSVGDFDYVKAVLDRLGRMEWMQVAIRPAKPLAFGVVGDPGKPVFGLPGNPVSSMVSFELFARPGLRQLMGFPPSALVRPAVPAVADSALPGRPDGKVHFDRVVASVGADGRYHVRSAGGQASHQLLAMAEANGLAVLPDGDGVAAGGEVDVLLLS